MGVCIWGSIILLCQRYHPPHPPPSKTKTPKTPAHNSKQNQKRQKNKLKARVYKERLTYAISALPSPLEFLGYVYCFTTFLAGPGRFILCVM